jgi:hypothetical protein
MTPYDIIKAISTDEELSHVFPVPTFPFRQSTFREPDHNNLAARFSESYTEADFLDGLNDYIDEFIRGIRRMPEAQLNASLTALGGPLEGTLTTRQNAYIAMILSRIKQVIQQYAQNHSGQLLGFSDLLTILTSLQ